MKTHQMDGCHRDRCRPRRPCSQRQSARRCTDQRGESLVNVLVAEELIDSSICANLRHEQRGPEMAFSEEALLQEQLRALSLPQEHLA